MPHLNSAAAHRLEQRRKLEVKVSCQSLAASLRVRAASLVTLLSPRLSLGTHWNRVYFISRFILTNFEGDKEQKLKFRLEGFSPVVSTCVSGSRRRRGCYRGALLHSPAAGGDERVASTATLPVPCAALRCPVLKRIYLVATVCMAGMSSTAWSTEDRGETLTQPPSFDLISKWMLGRGNFWSFLTTRVEWVVKLCVVIRESKATLLRADAVFFFRFPLCVFIHSPTHPASEFTKRHIRCCDQKRISCCCSAVNEELSCFTLSLSELPSLNLVRNSLACVRPERTRGLAVRFRIMFCAALPHTGYAFILSPQGRF